MLQIYENIKAHRLALGMTQTELALKIGYADKSMIAKIEQGQIDLPQSKIIAFATLFGVSAGDLMGSDGIVVSPISPTDQSLLDAYHRAPQEIRDIVNTALTPYYSKEEMKVG